MDGDARPDPGARQPGTGPEPDPVPTPGQAYRDPALFRVSDADRDRVAAELSEHFQAGRLTQEEFDERVGQAMAARTQGDLDPLLADLPATRPPGRLPASGTGGGSLTSWLPMWAVPAIGMVAAIVVVTAVFGGVVGGHGHGGWAPWWIIAVPIFWLLRRNRPWRG